MKAVVNVFHVVKGTKRMLEVLERIVAGNGTLEDLSLLEELGDVISATALCGLGKVLHFLFLSTLERTSTKNT